MFNVPSTHKYTRIDEGMHLFYLVILRVKYPCIRHHALHTRAHRPYYILECMHLHKIHSFWGLLVLDSIGHRNPSIPNLYLAGLCNSGNNAHAEVFREPKAPHTQTHIHRETEIYQYSTISFYFNI